LLILEEFTPIVPKKWVAPKSLFLQLFLLNVFQGIDCATDLAEICDILSQSKSIGGEIENT